MVNTFLVFRLINLLPQGNKDMWVYALFLMLATLTACAPDAPEIQKVQGQVQGTTFHINYWGEASVDHQAVVNAIQSTFDSIDTALSNYRPDSVIEQFNVHQSTLSQAVVPEINELVRVGQMVNEKSQGCFDLTIKPVFDLWGFAGETLNIPSPEQLAEQMAKVGMNKLQIIDDTHLAKTLEGVRVDVSAVAQGYSVGRISQVLEQLGIKNYLVEIGGELKSNGHKPDGQSWRVAIEKPLPGERKVHKVITMPKDAAMSIMTSGTYRHFYELNGQRYSHILDARNGKPVSHDLVAVTVLHEDPTVADAWSTTLLCLGPVDGMKLANAEKLNAIFIRLHGSELLETRSDTLKTTTLVSIQ